MFIRKKITCYVLVYDQLDIIKRSLDFLTCYSDKLDIIVIENPSSNTKKISALIDSYGKNGVVKRYYLFSANITGKAYEVVINQEIRKIMKTPFVIITDGDLICENNNWLQEEINILRKHRDVFACGISLEMSNLPTSTFPSSVNWIPPDMNVFDDYNEAYTGGHLLLMRGAWLADYMAWSKDNKLHFLDSNMHKFCYEVMHKKWARTKYARAYHITWDLYQDKEHPYTKQKTKKSFDEIWRHNNNATYTLKKY